MSIDLKGICGICLYPLWNGEKVAYHEKYTDDSGQVCDGSKHPLHLTCVMDALKKSGIQCSSCRVPINLKSVGMYLFNKAKYYKDKETILEQGLCASTLIGMCATFNYLPTLSIYSWLSGSNQEIIDKELTKVAAMVMSAFIGVVGYIATDQLVDVLASSPLYCERKRWIESDNLSAKMITVEPKPPKKWVKRQPAPGHGGYKKPMQRK